MVIFGAAEEDEEAMNKLPSNFVPAATTFEFAATLALNTSDLK